MCSQCCALFTVLCTLMISCALAVNLNCSDDTSNGTLGLSWIDKDNYVVELKSNTSYSFVYCTYVPDSGASLLLVLRRSASSAALSGLNLTLENVNVRVEGGKVLPVVSVEGFSLVRNVSVEVTGVAVVVNATKMVDDIPLAILSVFHQSINTVLQVKVYNLSVMITSSSVHVHRIDNNATSDKAHSSDTALLLFVNTGTASHFTMKDAVVAISNSNLAFSINGMGARSSISMVSLGSAAKQDNSTGLISNISVIAQNTSFSMFIDATNVSWGYDAINPSMFSFRCIRRGNYAQNGNCIIEKIAIYLMGGPQMRIVQLVPGYTNVSNSSTIPVEETPAMVQLRDFDLLSNVTITMEDMEELCVRCVCATATCTATSIPLDDGKLKFFSVLSARLVHIDAREGISSVNDFAFTLKNVQTIRLEAPNSAIALLFKQCASVSAATIMIATCPHIYLHSRGMVLGMTSRVQGLAVVNKVSNVSHMVMSVTDSTMNASAEGGGCNGVIAGAIHFDGGSTMVRINIHAVHFFSDISNGSIYVLLSTIAPITTLSTFVSIANTSIARIHIKNSTISAAHTCKPPLRYLAALLVLSIITAIHSPSRTNNGFMILDSVHVRRLSPDTTGEMSQTAIPYFPLPQVFVQYNFTTMVHMLDATAFAVQSNDALYVYRELVVKAASTQQGSDNSTSSLVNSTMSIVGGCSVRYEARLADAMSLISDDNFRTRKPTTDIVSYVVLPVSTRNSSIHIGGAGPIAQNSGETVIRQRYYGAIVGAIGGVSTQNTTISAANVDGVSILIFAANQEFLLNETTVITFMDITLANEYYSGAGGLYAIGVQNASIAIKNAATTSFRIHRCRLRDFDLLFMPNTFQSYMGAQESNKVIRGNVSMGCNLWNDDIPLPYKFVGASANSQARVSYPSSLYNSTLRCHGSETISITQLKTSSASLYAPLMVGAAASPIALSPVALNVVVSVMGVMGGLVGGGEGLLDAQVLIAMGQSVCSTSSLKESTSSSQFLLSPFYSFGSIAMVLGNLGIFAVVLGIHGALFVIWKRFSDRRRQSSTKQLFDSITSRDHHHHHQSASFASSTKVQKLEPSPPPEVALKFPNHSMRAASYAASGIVVGAMRGWSSNGEALDIVGAGAIGSLAILFGAYWRIQRVGKSRQASQLKFRQYRLHQRQAFVAPWALPLGIWVPHSVRATHGRLRSAVRSGKEMFSELNLVVSLLIQAIVSIAVPTSWCMGMWFVTSAVECTAVVIIVVHRPARAPVADVLHGAGLVVQAALQLVTGALTIVLEDSTAEANSMTIQHLNTALSILAVLLMFVTFMKTIHTMVIFFWERNATVSSTDDVALDTSSLSLTRLNSVRRATSPRTPHSRTMVKSTASTTKPLSSVLDDNSEHDARAPRVTARLSARTNSKEATLSSALQELVQLACERISTRNTAQ